jgi:alpha-L-fucosidase 2
VGLRARLGEAEKAHEQVARYLSDNVLTNLFSRCGRALQVDGSFGTTAGIAEMLLQSHTDTLDVLPALPAEWPNGRITGLRARGGLTVDLTWANGRVEELVLHPSRTGSVIVRGTPNGRVEPAADAMAVGASGELRLDLRPERAYRIVVP